MTIKTGWLNEEKTIASYQFEGRWTWDELYAAIQEVKALLKTVPHQVDVVIDFTRSYSVPPGALTHLRSITMGASPNWGTGVFVGLNAFTRTLVNTFVKVYPKLGARYAVANKLEEALKLIAQRQKEHSQSP